MYDGFISYSHSADRPLARSLQRSLHRIGRPWYRPRALRVFRDDVSLAASPDLWSSIQDALLASRTFTLMACPESAASPWVAREAALWREKKSRDTFLIVLTGGELVWDDEAGDFDWDRTTALPRCLEGWFTAEPLWVDLRERERRSGKEFRSAAATLAAAIHGVAKDELISEDLRQQRRLVSVLASLLTLALVAGGVAVWQQRVAVAQRDRATEQARIALSRALSGEAQRLMSSDPQLAVRLALSSWSASRSVQAKAALMSTLDQARHVLSIVSPGTDTVSRNRHANVATRASVAMSADGAVVAHAYSGGKISLWDTKSRRPITFAPPDWTSALALSGDGSLLAGTDGSKVKVWNTRDGSLTHDISFSGDLNRLAMSSNGRWLAISGGNSGGATPKFGVWNLETGRPVIEVEDDNAPGGPLEFRGDHLYTADGRSPQAKVAAFEPESSTWTTFGAGRVPPHGLAVSGSTLALLNGSALELWDLGTRTRTHTTEVGKDACCVSISADGRRIAAGTEQGAVLLYDQTLAQTTQLFQHPIRVQDLRVSDDGTLVASIAENGTVVVTSPDRDGRMRAVVQGPPGVSGVAVSAGGTAAVSGSGGVVLRELSTLAEKSKFSAPGRAVRLSPDGQRLSVGRPGALTTWDTTTGAQVGSIIADEIGFLSDSRHLVTARPDGTPVVEDAGARGTKQVGGSPHDQQIATNLKGDVIAVVNKAIEVHASGGGTDLTLWRWDGGALAKIRQVHFAALVRGFAVSNDGAQVAATDIDGRVLLDDGRPGGPVVFGRGVDSAKASVAFASGLVAQLHPETGELVLWNSADGGEVGTWRHPGAAGKVAGLAATGDGGLLTAEEDGLLTLWEGSPDAWTRTLCTTVTGGLSTEERQRYLGDVDVPWPC